MAPDMRPQGNVDENKPSLTKQQHPEEVCALPAERPLLKSLAVLYEKKTCGTENPGLHTDKQ